MDDGSRSTWLIVILLLLAAMLFAVMETAFASVSRVRIKTGAEKGEKKAVRALYVIEHFDRAITTLDLYKYRSSCHRLYCDGLCHQAMGRNGGFHFHTDHHAGSIFLRRDAAQESCAEI